MKNLTILILSLLNVMGACRNSAVNDDPVGDLKGGEIPVIRIDLAPDSAEIIGLSALFEDVEVVPLETSKECLVMNAETFMTDRSIILETQSDGLGPIRVFEFGLDGSFIREIGGGGKGPGEHQGEYSNQGAFYPESSVLHIQFVGGGLESQLFELNGRFIRNIKSPYTETNTTLRIDTNLYVSIGTNAGEPRYDRDSVLIAWHTIDGEELVRKERVRFPPANQKGYTNYSETSFYKSRDSWNIYFGTIDTLFVIDNSRLQAKYAIKHGAAHQPYNLYINPQKDIIGTYELDFAGEFNDYLVMIKNETENTELYEIATDWWGGTFYPKYTNLFYNKKSGEVFHKKLVDDLLGIIPKDYKYFQQHFVWDDIGPIHAVLFAHQLVEWIDEALENNTVPDNQMDKVKKLRSGINEESNPVLLLFKPKKTFELDGGRK